MAPLNSKPAYIYPIIIMTCLKYLQYLQVLSETSDYWLADRECHGYFSMVHTGTGCHARASAICYAWTCKQTAGFM